MTKATDWARQIRDLRSRRVIFVAHCLLNENTRYLGGACRGGAIREIVEPCLQNDVGIVQLPCPEQHAWGGVLKRRLLFFYGSKGKLRYRLRSVLLPLALGTRDASIASSHDGQPTRSWITKMPALPFWASSA
jgi:hypothetical protein